MRMHSTRNKVGYFINVILRQAPVFYRTHKKKVPHASLRIIGIMRERNEELLLQDSLDHLAQFVDAIVVFDDASTDKSVEIAKAHPAVIEVIENKQWRKDNRVWEETANRRKLYNRARSYDPEWFFYCDADERFEGDIKEYLINECPADVMAVRINLFDAYITSNDQEPYIKGNKLINFRKYFGPEKRDIIMIWRNRKHINYIRQDAREPQNIHGKQITKFYCQHYGKSLSILHWEETCNYYVNFFPKYRDKWEARKGKAIHVKSDFGRPLYNWNDVKEHSVKI